jgi:hypothetical protein
MPTLFYASSHQQTIQKHAITFSVKFRIPLIASPLRNLFCLLKSVRNLNPQNIVNLHVLHNLISLILSTLPNSNSPVQCSSTMLSNSETILLVYRNLNKSQVFPDTLFSRKYCKIVAIQYCSITEFKQYFLQSTIDNNDQVRMTTKSTSPKNRNQKYTIIIKCIPTTINNCKNSHQNIKTNIKKAKEIDTKHVNSNVHN